MDIGIPVIKPIAIGVVMCDPITDEDKNLFWDDAINNANLPEEVKQIIRDFFADINEYNIKHSSSLVLSQ